MEEDRRNDLLDEMFECPAVGSIKNTNLGAVQYLA